MVIKVGLFGYQGSGKTTLFKKYTGKEEENYDPFIPKIGIGRYEDERLKKIKEVLNPEKVIFPEFEFYDFKGFPEGEGFPPEFFKNFYNLDIIICVVKNFSDDAKPEVDSNSLIMELIFHDIDKLEGIKQTRDKEGNIEENKIIEKALEILQKEKLLKSLQENDKRQLSGIQLLTTKDFLIYLNGNKKKVNLPYSVVSEEEDIYKKIIEQLSMITFYTIKGNIAQGWIIPGNLSAKQAAGKIHKDIEKGFIKAAVLPWNNFVEIGDWKKAKNMGVLKFLGPNSIFSDGDVVEFYFSK